MRIKIMIFLMATFFGCPLKSQQIKMFLKDNNVLVPIYANENADSIFTVIMGDTIFEHYYDFVVNGQNSHMFKVHVSCASQYNSPSIEGWVEKKYCGVFMRKMNIQSNRRYILYDDHNSLSTYKIIEGEISSPVSVISYFEQWLQVKFVCNRKTYIGWINSYCSNIYNSCT